MMGDAGFQCNPVIRQQHWRGKKIINIVLGSRKEQLSSCKLKDAVKNMFFCIFSRKQEKKEHFFLMTLQRLILSTYGIALARIKPGKC